MCDFETTVYDKQDRTEVWAAACVKFRTEDVKIFHSIGELYEYFCDTNQNIIAYFHNLKFDGEFWMYYLIHDLGYTQSYYYDNPEDKNTMHFNNINIFAYSGFELFKATSTDCQRIVSLVKHNFKGFFHN